MTTQTEIKIKRLDYKNPTEHGFYSLPSLNSLEEIQDVNEVHAIIFKFETKEEAESFASNFPKSYKGTISTVLCSEGNYYYFSFMFNTFFMNETTGGENETAISRRLKVIKKIQSL